jgi:hypothetical protein
MLILDQGMRRMGSRSTYHRVKQGLIIVILVLEKIQII